jgi:hypothetical protein
MSNGFKACHKPDIALLNGAKIKTNSGPTAAWGGFLPHSSPSSSGFKSLPLTSTTINFLINLAKPDDFLINRTSQGGRAPTDMPLINIFWS